MCDSEIIAVTPSLAHRSPARPTGASRSWAGHERIRSHPRYAWYHYLNTPLALAAADELTDGAARLGRLGHPLPRGAGGVPARTRRGLHRRGNRQRRRRQHRPRLAPRADWRRSADCSASTWRSCRGSGRSSRASGCGSTSRPACSSTGAGSASRSTTRHVHEALDARFGFAHNAEHFTDQVRLGFPCSAPGSAGSSCPSTTTSPWRASCPRRIRPRCRRRASSTTTTRWRCPSGRACSPGSRRRIPMSTPGSRRSGLGDPAPPAWRFVREGLRVARGLPRRRYRLQMRPIGHGDAQSNLDHWDQALRLGRRRGEWSRPVGQHPLMWTATILPRIQCHVRPGGWSRSRAAGASSPPRGALRRAHGDRHLAGLRQRRAPPASRRFEVTPDGRSLPGWMTARLGSCSRSTPGSRGLRGDPWVPERARPRPRAGRGRVPASSKRRDAPEGCGRHATAALPPRTSHRQARLPCTT